MRHANQTTPQQSGWKAKSLYLGKDERSVGLDWTAAPREGFTAKCESMFAARADHSAEIAAYYQAHVVERVKCLDAPMPIAAVYAIDRPWQVENDGEAA